MPSVSVQGWLWLTPERRQPLRLACTHHAHPITSANQATPPETTLDDLSALIATERAAGRL
jgi:hypothetical protein